MELTTEVTVYKWTGVHTLRREFSLIIMLARSAHYVRLHYNVHHVPKLATPLASNTLNSVWSYVFQRNIVHCTMLTLLSCLLWRTHLTVFAQCNVIMTSEFADFMGWTWPAYYWQGDQAVAHPPKSLRRGLRWPLWAQTLRTSSEWSSPWMLHIL